MIMLCLWDEFRHAQNSFCASCQVGRDFGMQIESCFFLKTKWPKYMQLQNIQSWLSYNDKQGEEDHVGDKAFYMYRKKNTRKRLEIGPK